MKIEVEKQSLLKALAMVTPITKKQSAVRPVLNCVFMEALEGHLNVSATNLDMQISLGIRLRSGTGFKVAVNCQRLMAIVKHLSSELVELESLNQDSNNQLTIRAGESKFKLKCWDEDDVALFALPSTEQQPVLLDVGSFSRALKKVRPAASNDPARPALNSVMLELVGNHCTLFSTDGRRLAFSRLTQQNPDEVHSESILPLLFVDALSAVFPIATKVAINTSDRHAIFLLSEPLDESFCTPITISTKLVDVRYPNVRKVIPDMKIGWHSFKVCKDRMLDAVRRVGLIAGEDAKVLFKLSSGKVLLSSESREYGDGSDVFELETGTSDVDLCVGFNYHYIIDALRNLTEDSITIKLEDNLSPAVIEAGSFKSVIMPVRI